MTGSPAPRRIELLETLGQGGFGAVYLADVHSRDDFVQRLAIKVLSIEMSADADIAARQRDEARLLARLNHDHIVRVIDLTELDGRPAVLMEYVEGADASVLLRQGPVPVKAALQIGAAAASALDAAWSSAGPRTGQPLRVIHRDIKPANLLVSRHGGVKVLDFGIARGDFDREGKTGSVQFGTARFMAPEQWLYGQSSNKVDVYALGVSMVELLSGMNMTRAPLAGPAFAEHIEAVRHAVTQPEWPAGLARGIDGLLAGMLAFEADDRPDAAELFDAMAHLVDEAPGEGLRRWARRVVPPIVVQQRERWAEVPVPRFGSQVDPTAPMAVVVDDTAGAALSPSQAATARVQDAAGVDTLAVDMPQSPPPRQRSRVIGAIAAVVALFVLGAGSLGLYGWSRGNALEEPVTVSDQADEPAAVVEPAAAPVVEEAPTEPEPDVVEAAASEPAAPPQPTPRRSSTPSPAAAAPVITITAEPDQPAADAAADAAVDAVLEEPLGAEAPPAATVPITLSSTPWGAQVAVDSRVVGTTPVRNLALTVGAHTITMTKDSASTSHTITVGGRNPTSHTWTVETDAWRSSQ